jgi:DNA-binding beta-propeller fold protein YncE
VKETTLVKKRRLHGVATATMMLLATTANAATTDLLIGIDSKVAYNADGQYNTPPGTDAVLVLDIANPLRPRIRASLSLMNSLLGPPTNLQITPNGRLGLVANSVVPVQDGTAWKSAPDDKLFVIDLAANPPRLIDTVTVGKQPSGLAISKKGDLVLIANRAGKSVSVLSIEGTTVKLLADIPTGNEVAGVAITPDGKRAFAVMNTANKVAVLNIDGRTVTYDKAMDIPAAFNPYNVDITPDGRFAVAGSTGAGGLNNDALTVIDTTGPHPHVISLSTAGRGPEGFGFAPNGKWMVTALLLGSSNKHADHAYTRNGEAVLLSVAGNGTLNVVNRLPLGGLPEGVAFSANSEYVFIANYIDQNLQVFQIKNGKLAPTPATLKLPGQPASMRGVAR